MLSDYIQAAMKQAQYKILEDGTYFGELPFWRGIWSNAETLEECRIELQDVLEEWILLGLKAGESIPTLGDLDLNQLRSQEVA
ncbi:MAG: type II toxin-antitoxin system HicB family antitoxin [Cyanobacteria bacterium CAN_BIN43]|nr:type II toxin-antitoxin system HicB family antitoxin [Cyanobacteria bacterium CAN_BIN43]